MPRGGCTEHAYSGASLECCKLRGMSEQLCVPTDGHGCWLLRPALESSGAAGGGCIGLGARRQLV